MAYRSLQLPRLPSSAARLKPLDRLTRNNAHQCIARAFCPLASTLLLLPSYSHIFGYSGPGSVAVDKQGSVAEDDQAIALDARLDQLTETGDAKARRNVVGILALPLRLVGIEYAAPLCGGDADYEVEVVLLGQ